MILDFLEETFKEVHFHLDEKHNDMKSGKSLIMLSISIWSLLISTFLLLKYVILST